MMLGMSTGIWFLLILAAAVLDWVIGDPVRIPHPIVYIGKLIGFLTKKLNKGSSSARKRKGLLLWILTIAITGVCVLLLQFITWHIHPVVFYAVNFYFLSTTLAAKCLAQEVRKVYDALKENDLDKARTMTGYLVGRDTTQLSEGELVRATVETTAENTIDGILAPMFYMFIGALLWKICPVFNPLVLAMVYKAVNTMDSMVGYVQQPYTDFGYFPAKLDDLFNFIIARLGSVFMLIGGLFLGYDLKEAGKIFLRDRRNHKSPNSAHPESVVAGLLGVQLGGTNTYFGEVLEKPTIGERNRPLVAEDIGNTISIMYGGEIVMMGLIGLIFAGVFLLG